MAPRAPRAPRANRTRKKSTQRRKRGATGKPKAVAAKRREQARDVSTSAPPVRGRKATATASASPTNPQVSRADDPARATSSPISRRRDDALEQRLPFRMFESEARVSERRASALFPIIGIGASAGGLEALEAFLTRVPADSGAAYIVVQHLDPTHKDMLVELLQRVSHLPVLQVTDGIEVKPDHCYIIPPNRDMSILHGTLHLLPQVQKRGLTLPIDFFLRSLAEDQHERAIAVILSGMGADGTLGVRAIKEHEGAVFVQALDSARFDGMPRSAIETGLADVVAPIEELPARIMSYRAHAPFLNRPSAAAQIEDKSQSALEKVFVLLRTHTGNDFFMYKRSTIYRRIERRLSLHQIDDIAQYVRFLRENPREIDLLFKELLIGVTSFFRDGPVWEHLRTQVMPALLAARASPGTLRAWVPGCSTGEEAYSLAMTFKEALEPLKPVRNISMQIFATDLDRDAIEKARQGLYPDNIAADVSPERLRRFFVQEERGYRVGQEIREMVVFAPQNIIMDPPFTKLDILCCRNLLIYLSGDLQKKLIPLFHYSLNPDGVLFLGSAETVGSFSNLFAPLDAKARMYRRLDQTVVNPAVEFPTAFLGTPSPTGDPEPEEATSRKPAPPNLERLVDRLLVQRFAPLGILCNHKGDVLYVSGRAGKYLEPAVGRANLNILSMARDGLRYELSAAVAKVVRDDRTVVVHGVTVGTNGGTQVVDLTVQRVSEPKELRGAVLVVIADVADKPLAPKLARSRKLSEPRRVAELEDELQRARRSADHARTDADLAGRAEVDQRRAAIRERRAAEHERRTDHVQRRDAVAQRRAADGEPRAAVEGRRAIALQQRHEEPAEQHRRRHAVPRRRAARASLHDAHCQDHQAHPRRCRPADHRHRVRPRLFRARRRRARGVADLGIQGETRCHARRPLVHRAHHALSHARKRHRRRRDHVHRHHRGARARGRAARTSQSAAADDRTLACFGLGVASGWQLRLRQSALGRIHRCAGP